MGDDALTERARELAGEISAAEANLAAVLAEVERRGIHSDWECRDVVRFAGWHLQYAPGRARALADVGRAMSELPVVAEAVADGTLSFDKAKSIVRVAAPETERALVDMALHATTAQTQRICGKWGKVAERDATDPDTDDPVEQRPTVLVVTDDDGIELRIRFDHVHGQLVLASIDSEAKAIRNERTTRRRCRPGRRPTTRWVGRRVTRTAPSTSSPSPNGEPWASCVSRNDRLPSSPKACRPRGSTPPSWSTSASTPSTAPTSPTLPALR